MKSLITSLLMLFAVSAFSQDVIEPIKGRKINCQITYVDSILVKYNNINGIEKEMMLDKINKVVFGSNNKHKLEAFNKKGIYDASKDDIAYSSSKNINIAATTPGDHLIKAKNNMAAGISMQLVSAGVMGASSVIDDKNSRNIMLGVGGGIGLVGLILTIKGVVHIGKAGQGLNRIDLGNSASMGLGFQDHGIGLNIKL